MTWGLEDEVDGHWVVTACPISSQAAGQELADWDERLQDQFEDHARTGETVGDLRSFHGYGAGARRARARQYLVPIPRLEPW
jgi:hypothetical protein